MIVLSRDRSAGTRRPTAIALGEGRVVFLVRTTMRRVASVAIITALYVLHQDVWFWRAARPLVFGFLPIGLFYHAAFTVVTALALVALVRLLWPSNLDQGHTRP